VHPLLSFLINSAVWKFKEIINGSRYQAANGMLQVFSEEENRRAAPLAFCKNSSVTHSLISKRVFRTSSYFCLLLFFLH